MAVGADGRTRPEPGPDAPGPAGPTGSARTRSVVAGLVGLEAVALLAGAAYLGVESVIGAATERDAAVVEVVLAVLLAGGLGWCAVGVARARRWSRAPVVTWQLLQIAVAWPMFGSGWRYVGAVLVVLAVYVGYMVLGDRVVARGRDHLV